MRGRNRIIRMDEWDKYKLKPRFVGKAECRSELVLRPTYHTQSDHCYISLYRRTKSGPTFGEIKASRERADQMAEDAVSVFRRIVVGGYGEWCVITTPRRRSGENYHFATDVAEKIAERVKIKFYDNAIACINKDRINPQFFLLRPINEPNVLIIDDIITTGATLYATYNLVREDEERKAVICIVGIYNK